MYIYIYFQGITNTDDLTHSLQERKKEKKEKLFSHYPMLNCFSPDNAEG